MTLTPPHDLDTRMTMEAKPTSSRVACPSVAGANPIPGQCSCDYPFGLHGMDEGQSQVKYFSPCPIPPGRCVYVNAGAGNLEGFYHCIPMSSVIRARHCSSWKENARSHTPISPAVVKFGICDVTYPHYRPSRHPGGFWRRARRWSSMCQ